MRITKLMPARRALASLLLCAFAIGLAGCAMQNIQLLDDDAPVIQTFRDIPGITADEVAKIEALLATREVFTYGSLPSMDMFELPNGPPDGYFPDPSMSEPIPWPYGGYDGFAPRLCELLSGLFGIPFIPEMYDWHELKTGVDYKAIDFTGAINMTPDLGHRYYMTSPIAGNRLTVFVKEDGVEILSEHDLMGLRLGFYAGSSIGQITRNAFPRIDFEAVEIDTAWEMANMLTSGAIDAFILDTADVFAFYEYDGIKKVASFPYVYVPVTVSTADPELAPVISAITKYMMARGLDEVERLYGIGEHAYSAHVFGQLLNDDERAYIARLESSGEAVPVGFSTNRYPIAYYDANSKEFRGIAADILEEITLLSRIEFRIPHDETVVWTDLVELLDSGEIKLLSQLIRTPPREGYYLWPENHYFTSRYAFISNVQYPYLKINEVSYVNVGVVAGSAEETRYREWFLDDTDYKTYASTDEALTALERGEIDLFLCLDYTLLYETNYRENPNQRINILFDTPTERVYFGLNLNEQTLCSIIEKAQSVVNTERIVRDWTSRVFDQSKKIAEERAQAYAIFIVTLLVLLGGLMLFLIRYLVLTKKMKAQAQTEQEAHSSLQSLLDITPAGIVVVSRDTEEIIYANEVALRMFDVESLEKDVQGRNVLSFMTEFQPDGVKSSDYLAELWRLGEAVVELQCQKLSGVVFVARLAYCLINYNGIVASVNVMEDLTAEKEYQQMLRDTALKEQEANQLKSRFLAMVSHEIRTPMNAIIGMAELALRESDTDARTRNILTIKQAGSNLLAIINDILDFSKIEAGKLDITPAEYSVSTLLNDVVSIISMRTDDTQIDFTVKVDGSIPKTLIGDETRVRQAILNLLTNAVKYTEKGFVTLGLYGSFADDGETVELTIEVADSGIGIKPENIDKLFTDFTQFEHARNKGVEGVGLGLAITSSIVKTMGGHIAVESEYGKGSTFTLTLPQRYDSREPLVPASDEGEKNEPASDEGEGEKNLLVFDAGNADMLHGIFGMAAYDTAGESAARFTAPDARVLIVDDMKTNRYVAKGLLAPYEMTVDLCASGPEALAAVQSVDYDLVFMDHKMPGMDGVEATLRIRDMGRRDERFKELPIVALTANVVSGMAEMFMVNGFNDFLPKPIETIRLNSILERWIPKEKQVK
uniref:histidine kinase n=1 Tax=uncultured bacterium contig00045 TaxID=1181531 RepID=A0A806JZJ1_9BACT|nr:putative hybrid sensor and regulator [uncultured bacterium contig00045]